jgi:3-oxoadipate enol-lactonase
MPLLTSEITIDAPSAVVWDILVDFDAYADQGPADPEPARQSRPRVKDRSMTNLSHFTAGDGSRLAYRLDGAEERPVLVLSNSIATTLRMWDRQVPELASRFRVLRYDTRGHGASDVPSGAYSLERLGRDVIELLDELNIETVTFVGLSFGGLIGQWLGIYAAERLQRLILANTSPYLGPPEAWDEQIRATLAATDMSAIAEMFLSTWLPPRILKEDAVVGPLREDLLALDPVGLAGSFAAIRDADLRRTIRLITAPTLVIAGAHDPVTLPDHGRLIAETIPGARFVELQTKHLSNVEQPDEFLAQVFRFLDETDGLSSA